MDQIAPLRDALAGRYDISREIGAGGMATVYLARDVKHDRNVALKVLKPELGAVLGGERFLSEIRVTANLQHPNLLPLFDSGVEAGMLFYVMPFVEGETLRAKLDREHQLPIDETLRIATSIASALGHAHSHGVIHRDLKPENILLHAGQPVISDFGIALAISNAGGARVTQTGISLGTPQYMSPEQAAGDRGIDARSDIYSLGAMVYEMLAGTAPHSGGSAQAIIAKLMTADPPPLSGLRPTTPAAVARAVEKALSRVPADRFTSAEKFADALQLGATSPELSSQSGAARNARRAWPRHPATLLLAAMVVALGASVAWLRVHPAMRADTAVLRFSLALPKGARIVGNGLGPLADIAPDGRSVVYVGESPTGSRMLWLRDLDDLVPRALEGTDNAETPVFSPDGSTIVYLEGAADVYRKVPRKGGTIETLFPSLAVGGITFAGQDSLVFADGPAANILHHLRMSSARGGKSVRLTDSTINGGTANPGRSYPVASADGKYIFFITIDNRGATASHIGILRRSDRTETTTDVLASRVLGYIDGILYYAKGAGSVYGVPFDATSGKATGEALASGDVAMTDGIGPRVTLSAQGNLAYVAGSLRNKPVLVEGNVSAPLGLPERAYSFPRYSPDGKSIAITATEGDHVDVWIYHIALGSFERLTRAGTINDRPEWWPDGRSVIFRSNRAGMLRFYRQQIDASSEAVPLGPAVALPVQEVSVSPDTQTLLLRVDTPDRARDVLTVPLAGGTPQPYLSTTADELGARFSPSGKYVAYMSNESGRDEIYVRTATGAGARIMVSNGGGSEALWSRDGSRLYYRNGERLYAVVLATTPQLSAVRRDLVFEGSFLSNRLHPMYDVAPDGKHLLVLAQENPELDLTLVLNWARNMKTKLSAAR